MIALHARLDFWAFRAPLLYQLVQSRKQPFYLAQPIQLPTSQVLKTGPEHCTLSSAERVWPQYGKIAVAADCVWDNGATWKLPLIIDRTNRVLHRKPCNREFEFPAHSLFDPCSESSQKLSFTGQRALQQGLTSQGLHLKAQHSLYFSLLAGNFRPEKVRARLRPPPPSSPRASLSTLPSSENIVFRRQMQRFAILKRNCLSLGSRNREQCH
jgi:hypothetical protein